MESLLTENLIDDDRILGSNENDISGYFDGGCPEGSYVMKLAAVILCIVALLVIYYVYHFLKDSGALDKEGAVGGYSEDRVSQYLNN